MDAHSPSPRTPLEDSVTGHPGRVSTSDSTALGSALLFFAKMLKLVTVGIWIHVICVLLSPWHAVFELTNHFCYHSWLVSAGALVLLLVLKEIRWSLALATACVFFTLQIQPWSLYGFSSSATSDSASNTFPNEVKVLSWNMLSTNRSIDAIREKIESVDPDVLILIEVRPGLLDQLPDLALRYPHSVVRPAWGGEGIGVFSRVDGTKMQLQDFGYADQPGVAISLPGQGGRSVSLVALHTLSPLLPVKYVQRRTEIRDIQFKRFLEWSELQNGPVAVCGDFNATPWTSCFRSLTSAGFRDSRIGAGNQASWPESLGHFGIPIDHALWRGPCLVSDRRVLDEGPGSDHRPLEFRLHY